MSVYPLSYIYEGDFTLKSGSDTQLYGVGDLNVLDGITTLYNAAPSTNSSTGTLVVFGGVGIVGTVNIQTDLNAIYGTSSFSTVNINTDAGPTTITGLNGIIASVGSTIQFACTSGNINLSANTGYVNVNGHSGINVITGVNGSINGSTGVNGGVSIISGNQGITQVTSSGNLNLISNNASGSFTVNSVSNAQNLVLSLQGTTDSKILVESAGTGTGIQLSTLNTAGSILINNDVTGTGSISLYSGSGGINIGSTLGSVIVNGNSINLKSPTNTSISSGGLTGIYSRSIALGTSIGGVSIAQPNTSTSGISIFSGNSGLSLASSTGGSISLETVGAGINLQVNSTGNGENLLLQVSGTSSSSIILDSFNAIVLNTSSTNGNGVSISSGSTVNVDGTTGINIGTASNNAQVIIGGNASTTTINGNLDVKGSTTTIESITTVLTDNIFIVNNGPSMISDGGIGIKRYQPSNNANGGSIITDTPTFTGTVAASGNSFTTINLGTSASSTNGFYNDWIVYVSSGTGNGQVRVIKSYDGSTNIATIYSTADETASPSVPVKGLDYFVIPDNTSTYSLFYSAYQFMIWDESHGEFVFTSYPSSPGETIDVQYYSNVHLGNLIANNITGNYLNNVPIDTVITFTLTNNSMSPITVSSFPALYGVFQVMIRPTNDSNGTFLTYTLNRSNQITKPGNCTRTSSTPGANNEQIVFTWPTNSLPLARYSPSKGITGTTIYSMRISTI